MNLPEINSDTVILTFTDSKYLPIFDIWYSYFNKLNLTNLLVVSLDRTTYDKLVGRNIRTILREFTIVNKSTLWVFRLNIIIDIFNKYKKNILHSDSDCLWFKDIYNAIRDLPYDFIGSNDIGCQFRYNDKSPLVICCGLYYVKYNDRIIDFHEKIIEQINLGVDTDDQILFNKYFLKNMVSKTNIESDIIAKEFSLANNMKLGLIKLELISRYYYNDKLYCYHPVLNKKRINGKIRQLYFLMKNDKCERTWCPYKRHSNPYLCGGTHCCVLCKLGDARRHGKACEKNIA